AAFTKSLAKELASKGITVNAVAPGFIETDMVESIPERVRGKLLEQIPLRRFGRIEEVARAVVYIVSSDGDYITGAELSINGGLLMKPLPPGDRRRGTREFGRRLCRGNGSGEGPPGRRRPPRCVSCGGQMAACTS